MVFGIDFIIGFLKNYFWVGVGSKNKKGYEFMVNMLIEEVFCCVDKLKVEGYVFSMKLFSYVGNIIDDFKIIFEKGCIVGVEVVFGEEILKDLIVIDEGFYYLGEVVLVLDFFFIF